MSAHINVIVGEQDAWTGCPEISTVEGVGALVLLLILAVCCAWIWQPTQGFYDVRLGAVRRHGGRTGIFDPISRQMSHSKRDGDMEGAALPECALDRYRAAVELHQFLNKRKADTATLMAAALRSLYPMKSFEQLWEFVRGNANARIPYG
jgi:hypothetical protein